MLDLSKINLTTAQKKKKKRQVLCVLPILRELVIFMFEVKLIEKNILSEKIHTMASTWKPLVENLFLT